MKSRHPFEPIIFEHSKSILIGTLSPETTPFYFSNSPKTRLWDLLYAIEKNENVVGKGKYLITEKEKREILKNLSLSLADIIYEYDRKNMNSVEDAEILPYTYCDILSLIENTKITQILFLYKNAALWFLHSLKKERPLPIDQLNYNIDFGEFYKLKLKNREVSCKILPMPLNRGRKGETMTYKFEVYKGLIQ